MADHASGDRPRLHFVQGSEWSGLYIDGALVMEASILSAHDVLDVVAARAGLDFMSEMLTDEQDARLNDEGVLPGTLDELATW